MNMGNIHKGGYRGLAYKRPYWVLVDSVVNVDTLI